MKDRIVAIFTRVPMLCIKNFRIIIVPIDSIKIQNQYNRLFDLFVSSSTVRVMALGDASNMVSVVLNIVVKHAIPITTYIESPIVFVYKFMSWPANVLALLLKFSSEPYITNAPKATKQIPKNNVPRYPMLKSRILFLVSKESVFFFFSIAQRECQTEISNGAGIHPKKAIKNPISKVSFGKYLDKRKSMFCFKYSNQNSNNSGDCKC